jgi:hypothetical protein
MTAKRKRVRHKLEKNVARCWASKQRPTVWKRPNTLPDGPNVPVTEGTLGPSGGHAPTSIETTLAGSFGYEIVDAVEYYSRYLTSLNLAVEECQKEYFEQRQRLDEFDESRVLQVTIVTMHPFL